jgi:hypothetical protein
MNCVTSVNNPIKYSDPTGHIPSAEICKYLNICGKNAAEIFRNKYGDNLFRLLWNTDVSWGSTLIWSENGNTYTAYLAILRTGDYENGYHESGVLVGLDGKYKGRFLSLENLARFNSVGALKLNDPKEVGNIPLDNKFYDECNSSRCDVSVNDTYTFAEVEYDVHPAWWLLAVGSLTMGPEAPPLIGGVLWAADQTNALEQIVSSAGVETDMAKTIQYYYSQVIGSPGRSLPIITIEPAWSHFNYRK